MAGCIDVGIGRLCRRPTAAAAVEDRPQPVSPRSVREVSDSESLRAAAWEAGSGAVVVVRGGHYDEPLKIRTRDAWIRGKEGEDVVLHVPARRKAEAAIAFVTSTTVRLENLTIRNDGGYAISVIRSSPHIVSCTLTGAAGGVFVGKNHEYPGLYPVIHGCTVTRCRGPGIQLVDAKAVIEGCTLSHNADAAIAYSGLSNPWIKGNKVVLGRGAGIAVQDLATGVLRDNIVEGNACAGLVVEGVSHPVVWRNTFRNGGTEGARFESGSKGTLERNVFSGNAGGDLSILDGCGTSVANNSFRGGPVTALVIAGAHPAVNRNSFKGYLHGPCVAISGNAAPTLRGNTFTVLGGSPGVAVAEHAGGVVEKNVFRVSGGEPFAGISTQGGAWGSGLKVADNAVIVMEEGREGEEDEEEEGEEEETEDNEAPPPVRQEDLLPPKRRHSAFAERMLGMHHVPQHPRRRSEGDVSSQLAVCSGRAAVLAINNTPSPFNTTLRPADGGEEEEVVQPPPPSAPLPPAPKRSKSKNKKSTAVNGSESVLRKAREKEKKRSSSSDRPDAEPLRQSNYDVQLELEAVRKLLTPEECRQELQLLKNWLGPDRLEAAKKNKKHEKL